MKIIKAIVALLFVSFATLQYNDPDPWLWIIIYGIAAAMIMLDISGVDMRRYYRIGIAAMILFSLIYLPGVITYLSQGSPGEITESMSAEKTYIEETREFFGLYIIVFAFLIFYFKSKNKR